MPMTFTYACRVCGKPTNKGNALCFACRARPGRVCTVSGCKNLTMNQAGVCTACLNGAKRFQGRR